MQVTVDYDKNFMYFTQLTPKELEWLEAHLTWYYRDGSLKTLKPGDLVQESGTKKVGKFKEFTGDKGRTMVYDLKGEEKEALIFDMTPVAKETIFYKNKKGQYYTLWGLKKLIEQASNFKINVENPRDNKYERVKVDPNCLEGITLDPYQVSGVSKALTILRGFEIVPTGGGKTEMMLATMKYILDGKDDLDLIACVVPTVLLAEQFQGRSIERGFNKGVVGIVSGGVKEYGSPVLVFTMASLLLALRARDPEIMKYLKRIKYLFIDETHHLRCNSMLEIVGQLGELHALLGYSGSPFTTLEPLEDSGDALMWGMTGGPIFEVPYEHLIEIGRIARPVVHFRKIPGKLLKFRGRFQKIYDQFIMNHVHRTELVVKYAARAADMGFKVLILVQRLEHAAEIMKQLENYKVISVFGGKTAITRNEDTGEHVVSKINYNTFRADFEEGGYQIAIGSTVADEGMDLPSVGFVCMAGGGKSRIKVLQRLGRGLRKKLGMNFVYIMDFQDMGHVYLNAHSNARKKLYKEAKADIIEDEIMFWQRMHMHMKQLKGENNAKGQKTAPSAEA